MFGGNGIKYMRHPKGERFALKHQMPTVKPGGCYIMVWRFFSHDSIEPLHCIEGIMGQNVHLDKIKSLILPHGKDKMPCGWIFQQDNNPKHYANSINIFYNSKKIPLLDWPSRSFKFF